MSEGDNWLFILGDGKVEDCEEFGSELGELGCGEFDGGLGGVGGEFGGVGSYEVDCGDTLS